MSILQGPQNLAILKTIRFDTPLGFAETFCLCVNIHIESPPPTPDVLFLGVLIFLGLFKNKPREIPWCVECFQLLFCVF